MGENWYKKSKGEWDNLLTELTMSYSNPSKFSVDKYGIECLRCKIVTGLTPCGNCGSYTYKLGVSTNEVLGLFCTNCAKGLTRLACECSCENPISRDTLVKNSACFIATACTSPISWQVVVLSEFRDTVLREYYYGRLFITIYESLSPCIATVIANSLVLKRVFRIFLITPLACSVTLLKILSQFLYRHMSKVVSKS